MYQHKRRRFKHRSNGRGRQTRNNEGAIVRLESSLFSNSRMKNNFRTHQSAEQLASKYNTLAREALSSGDKILSENYFQHAEHFMRIIDEKSLNQNQNKAEINNKSEVSDKLSVENNKIKQDQSIENKKE